ncbi:hypothetical protein GCM10007301_08870 [Azorhizobium oxalatiphilum]|uniref:DUF2934 domain-containing protein n=1 Tax=Azorhizobium oxalatiphilum TaxID=980631 RepID=A0A917BP57_9HYPH|nr:DUF2934 domain-containing protein [Azorhizobium oxalatiphilum]GGF51627.1 hypothetical protein GCM10007301_08870 [Azorhizobium oxalatiphilum]
MSRIEDRVRDRAHQLWEEEGRPEGRGDLHWAMAERLVALEESDRLTREPCPQAEGTETPRAQELAQQEQVQDGLGADSSTRYLQNGIDRP